MVTVIWAAAAGVIIMDGAEDAVITTAGHAVIIVTVITNSHTRDRLGGLRCRASMCDSTIRDKPAPATEGADKRCPRCLGS